MGTAVLSSSTGNDGQVTSGKDLWEASKPQSNLDSLLEVDDAEQALAKDDGKLFGANLLKDELGADAKASGKTGCSSWCEPPGDCTSFSYSCGDCGGCSSSSSSSSSSRRRRSYSSYSYSSPSTRSPTSAYSSSSYSSSTRSPTSAYSSSSYSSPSSSSSGRCSSWCSSSYCSLSSCSGCSYCGSSSSSSSYSYSSSTRAPTRSPTSSYSSSSASSPASSAAELAERHSCVASCTSAANCCQREQDEGLKCYSVSDKCCGQLNSGCGHISHSSHGSNFLNDWMDCVSKFCCRKCGVEIQTWLLQTESSGTKDSEEQQLKQKGDDSLLALLSEEETHGQRAEAGWNTC